MAKKNKDKGNAPRVFANQNMWEAYKENPRTDEEATWDVNNQYAPQYSLSVRRNRVEAAMEEVFDALGIHWRDDPNMKGTPARVAKMYVDEIFGGRFQPIPKVTSFPNTRGLDQMIVVGPIKVKSMCSHHLMPIYGKAWIGILPKSDGQVLGLSKFPRIVDWISRRPQIQEELTQQIADAISKETDVNGLAVYVEAKHMCTSHRGIQDENTVMRTSVLLGMFRDAPSVKEELFSIIRGSGVEL